MNRVLIAGSERLWTHSLANSLLHAGYSVDVAESGVACVTKLRFARPNALVLDETLFWGGSDGVLDFLREAQSEVGNPVVMLMGEPQSSCNRPYLIPAWVHRLPKPMTTAAVAEAVRKTTGRLISGPPSALAAQKRPMGPP